MEFLKTGGIKNRWNFFLSKKTGGIIPPVPPVSGGSKTPCPEMTALTADGSEYVHVIQWPDSASHIVHGHDSSTD